jgi:hypothetical protein
VHTLPGPRSPGANASCGLMHRGLVHPLRMHTLTSAGTPVAWAGLLQLAAAISRKGATKAACTARGRRRKAYTRLSVIHATRVRWQAAVAAPCRGN